jgi:peptide/nickel transport system substrate-binding protein
MNRHSVWLTILMVTLGLLILAACAPAGAPAPAAQPPAAEETSSEAPAAEGKTLVVADGTEPAGLYPPTSTGPPGTLDYLLYDPLVGHTENMEPDADRGLATSWEIGDDQVTWTFELREGVKFHDGTDFDANAVKVTLESILDPETGANRRSVYTVIEEVRVVDPLTVEIVTTEPFPDLPFLLMDRSAFIVSPTALEEMGIADFALNPVGTGPFRFVEWVPNDHITFEANPDYWQGPPELAEVIYRPVPEDAARTAMLKTGEVDIALNISPEDLADLEADANITVVNKDSMSQVTSEMRQTEPPFNDARVRQAMNYALDSESIIENIMQGAGSIPRSPAPPNVWGSVDLEPYSYDPDTAKALLAEAGYPDGFEGDLFYVSGRWAGDEQVTQAMQAYWQAVGVTINLHKVDQAGLVDNLKKHPDTMAGWTTQQIRTSSYLDYHLYRLFNCDAAIMEAAQRSGYCNPEVDELLAKGRSTFDLDEREQYYQEAQKLIWEDAPFVWVFNRQNLLGHRTDVTGFEFLPISDLRLHSATKSE